MPQYRLFLLDRNNHIVGATERECVEHELELVARDVLQNGGFSAAGVEVWHGNRRLKEIKRS